MRRRSFLTSLAGLVIAGPEVLERLGWKRTMFPGANFSSSLGRVTWLPCSHGIEEMRAYAALDAAIFTERVSGRFKFRQFA